MKRIIRTSAFKNGLFNKDRFFISLFLLVGIGIFIGTVTAGTNANSSESVVNSIWNAYIEERKTQSIAACFFGSLSSAIFVFVLSYILGVCAVGAPFLYATIVFDAIGRGMIFGFLYLKYGFLGFLKSLIFFMPQNVLMCILILAAVRHSIKMSKRMFCFVSERSEESNHLSFKKYNQRYLFFAILAVIISFFDAIMSRFTALITG